jgi:glycosyltransferase involved in cell wall biosynthesis
MPRLLFVNRFFHPDHSATSQLLSDLAFALAETGFDVEVITSRQRYDNPAAQLPASETVRGVRVHRVWTTRLGRQHLLPRALDYLTFYAAATLHLAARADRDTIIIAETDPPLMSVPAALAARLRRADLVNWIQDLFPEVAEALRVPGVPWIAPVLKRLRNLSLRMARTNVVLGESMAERLRQAGVAPEKVKVIPNWSLSESEPLPIGAPNPSRTEWGLDGKFVVGYSGNLGRAHDFETILDAAYRLRDRDDIRFLFVGDGAQRGRVEQRAAELGLSNIVFRPYQPLERLALSLAVPDVHLVSLKPEMEGLIVPSKLYAVLAAGRGVLYLGDTKGEIARLVTKEGCGMAFGTRDGERLAGAIGGLAKDRSHLVELGTQARALWETQFRRQDALGAWREALFRLRGTTAS